MPTYNQLKESWRVQRGIFGTHGLPSEHYTAAGVGMGLVDEPNTDKSIDDDSEIKLTGKVYGVFRYCEVTKEKQFFLKDE